MVDAIRAVLGDDALLVEPKAKASCIDSNRYGFVHKSGGQLDRIVSWNLNEVRQLHLGLHGLVGPARLVSCLIRIGGLISESMVLRVVEGILDKASGAAIVAEGDRAVDQLLLREEDFLRVLDLVGGLDGSSSRERPAGATSALVLDAGHHALLLPVDRVRQLVGIVQMPSLVLVGLIQVGSKAE